MILASVLGIAALAAGCGALPQALPQDCSVDSMETDGELPPCAVPTNNSSAAAVPRHRTGLLGNAQAFGMGMFDGAKEAVVDTADAVMHPVRTAHGLVYAAVHPLRTIETSADEIRAACNSSSSHDTIAHCAGQGVVMMGMLFVPGAVGAGFGEASAVAHVAETATTASHVSTIALQGDHVHIVCENITIIDHGGFAGSNSTVVLGNGTLDATGDGTIADITADTTGNATLGNSNVTVAAPLRPRTHFVHSCFNLRNTTVQHAPNNNTLWHNGTTALLNLLQNPFHRNRTTLMPESPSADEHNAQASDDPSLDAQLVGTCGQTSSCSVSYYTPGNSTQAA